MSKDKSSIIKQRADLQVCRLASVRRMRCQLHNNVLDTVEKMAA